MSFSDYNCSLIVEPVSLLFLFCSSIARKRRQSGRRGKQVSLLPHEKELLAAVGEDEIRKLLAHQGWCQHCIVCRTFFLSSMRRDIVIYHDVFDFI